MNAIAQEILADMRHLNTQEMYDRARTIRVLRDLKNWSQEKLGQEVKRRFPNAAASKSTIWRIEIEKNWS